MESGGRVHQSQPGLHQLNRRVFQVPPYGRGAQVFRVGRKAAGRVLDGRTWDEFPEVTKGEPCCA